jgi:YfiR/HmsC-like
MRTYWRQTGLKLALPVMLVALLSCASAFSMADNNQATEYKVKAAFLYNFSRFVTWPENTPQENGKFNLCILGSDPFRELLNPLSGKSIHNSSLNIKRLATLDQEHTCQIIFISQTGNRNLKHIMSVLKKQPVLTVSDIEDFTAHGGIIQFKLVGNKVRFNINIDNASQAGLTISSKLLSLATIVSNDQQVRP